MYTYTLDEIIHLTGIPQNKAVEVCRLLCSEGFLVYEESSGQYRLTDDEKKLERLQKVKGDLKNEARAAEMFSKIQDIMTLGKPLALSDVGQDSWADIGIPGLNIIFGSLSSTDKEAPAKGEPAVKSPGLPRGHCLLIKGAPGTGKTTLGMQIAVYLEKAKYRSLFLTFEEDIDQLLDNLDVYCRKGKDKNVGWDKSLIKTVTRSIAKIQTPSAWEDPETVLQELISILDKELPQLVVVDSISRVRDIGGETKSRPVLRRLIRMLKIRKITSIFLGEDDEGSKAFADYEVDGVIRLGWEGDQLTLSLDKMRGMKSYKGPHSAALLPGEKFEKEEHKIISEEKYKEEYKNKPGASYLRPGFNVFPEISLYNEIPRKKEDNEGEKKKGPEELAEALDTGILGLNDLLEFKGKPPVQKGFKPGEAILIIGSAGAGKTLLGLNFMIAGIENKKQFEEKKKNESRKNKKDMDEGSKKKVGVWISLEGDIGTLESAVAGFENPWKQQYKDLYKDVYKLKDVKNEEPEYFIFFNFPPLNLDLNKIVYTLHALQGKYEIDRLVIDSITELERAKSGGQPEIKTFLAGLIQYLRDRKITTVFISRSETFFHSIDKLEEQVSSLVDLIICMRNFDMHNQIHKGIYIQKARGRAHNSKILRMTIDSKKGIDIEDSGWDLENLLAGDTSNIQGPKVFFKLFYENPAEKEVNEAIIKDFHEQRYPGEGAPTFSVVKKTSIYTEFWSFKGQYSSGHANTRVLSIPDYVINAFRDNDRLAEIDKYVKWEVIQKIENEETLINRYKEKKETEMNYVVLQEGSNLSRRMIDAVPCYLDYGVMVYNNKLIESPEIKELPGIKDFLKFFNDNKDNLCPVKNTNSKIYSWDELLSLLRNITFPNKENNVRNESVEKKDGIIPFAFPPLDKETEFVAFFMELWWSFGGDIFKSDVKIKKEIEKNKKEEHPKKEKKGEKKEITFVNEIRKSIFKEFIGDHLKEIDVFKQAFRDDKKPGEKSSQYRIINDFEKRFLIYGLEKKGIKIQEFKKWILSNLENPEMIKKYREQVSVLVLDPDDKSFKETIKLILRLVHWAGVPNPIDGEYRHLAVLSRNWYSQVISLKMEKCERCSFPDENCSVYKEISKEERCTKKEKEECMKKRLANLEEYRLLALPLAKNNFDGVKVYRSITCLTYWSLVMLKNALSPEIGGNFIESMNAPEYYERRLKAKAGMPVTYMEIKKEIYRSFDPESYTILNTIFENDRKKSEIVKYYVEKQNFREKINEIAMNSLENAFICMDEFSEMCENEKLKKEVEKEKYSLPDTIRESFNNRIFFSKVRQSRTAFYRLEEVLHYQLKQLFIDKAFRNKDIYPEDISFKENEEEKKADAVERLKVIFKNGTEKENEEDIKKCLDHIAKEFRTHIIFELLVYFYKKHLRGEEKEEQGGK